MKNIIFIHTYTGVQCIKILHISVSLKAGMRVQDLLLELIILRDLFKALFINFPDNMCL